MNIRLLGELKNHMWVTDEAGIITFVDNPIVQDSITIGGTTYTFGHRRSEEPYVIKIGYSIQETMDNLGSAIDPYYNIRLIDGSVPLQTQYLFKLNKRTRTKNNV